MKFKTALITLLLAISVQANADFTTISRAYEIALSDFRVAPMHNGSVFFRQCADCDAIRVRVTPSTRFVLNGEDVTLRDFRKSIFQVSDRAGATVIVLHHLETDTVVSVSINL